MRKRIKIINRINFLKIIKKLHRSNNVLKKCLVIYYNLKYIGRILFLKFVCILLWLFEILFISKFQKSFLCIKF